MVALLVVAALLGLIAGSAVTSRRTGLWWKASSIARFLVAVTSAMALLFAFGST